MAKRATHPASDPPIHGIRLGTHRGAVPPLLPPCPSIGQGSFRMASVGPRPYSSRNGSELLAFQDEREILFVSVGLMGRSELASRSRSEAMNVGVQATPPTTRIFEIIGARISTGDYTASALVRGSRHPLPDEWLTLRTVIKTVCWMDSASLSDSSSNRMSMFRPDIARPARGVDRA
jgi:hypothetical protein